MLYNVVSSPNWWPKFGTKIASHVKDLIRLQDSKVFSKALETCRLIRSLSMTSNIFWSSMYQNENLNINIHIDLQPIYPKSHNHTIYPTPHTSQKSQIPPNIINTHNTPHIPLSEIKKLGEPIGLTGPQQVLKGRVHNATNFQFFKIVI